VLAHRVGIWDVLDACRRPGSLDADIRDPRPNDFAALRRLAPRLKRVLFNGGTAGRFAAQFAAAGFATAVLPSSSPAHAGRSFEQKLALWQAALQGFLEQWPCRRGAAAQAVVAAGHAVGGRRRALLHFGTVWVQGRCASAGRGASSSSTSSR